MNLKCTVGSKYQTCESKVQEIEGIKKYKSNLSKSAKLMSLDLLHLFEESAHKSFGEPRKVRNLELQDVDIQNNDGLPQAFSSNPEGC